MPLLAVTNLTTTTVTLQDKTGQTGFNLKVPPSSTVSGRSVSAELIRHIQADLDSAVTAGRINYILTEDPTKADEVEKKSIRIGLVTPITATLFDEMIVSNLTSAGAVSVVLPDSLPVGTEILIADGKGDANTNNVTVTVANSGTINGSASLVLNTAYGAARVVKIAAQKWIKV